MSQGDVARRLQWSLSKVQRIEAGDVGVTVTDLLALLQVYGVDDPDRVARLTDDARISRRQRYVIPAEHREHLPPGMQQLMQFEQEARVVRIYQSQTLPGVLQTPAVAEAVLGWRDILSEERRKVRFEVRMDRRRRLIDRAGGPEFRIILDESVIHRRIRDETVFADQLDDLARSARQPWIHLRIVPFVRSAHWPDLGSFQLLDLEGEDSGSVLYREFAHRDEIIHDGDEIAFFRQAFEDAWDTALSEAETIDALVAEAASHRSPLLR